MSKMQCSLLMFVLMGQCSLLVCQLYEYHFIDEEKTWDKAKEFCRRHYTDLATVNNMTDVKRLRREEGWIGLRNQIHENRVWHWSMPGVEFNDSETQRDTRQPDNAVDKNCAACNEGKWGMYRCDHEKKFICHDEVNQKPGKAMKWRDAQIFCRQSHTDLISGFEQLTGHNGCSSKNYSWIGLFRDHWRWSDGSTSSFRNWDKSFEDEDLETCAMTLDDGYWIDDECNKEKPFYCYEDHVILIEEPKTWEEALYYCRDNYDDLVSINSLDDQRWVQQRAKMANTSHVWLGLRYTCTLDFWFWISDEKVTYKNWENPDQENECDMSGAMDTRRQHKWVKVNDMKELSFICSRH